MKLAFSERQPDSSRIISTVQDRFIFQVARRQPMIKIPELINRFVNNHYIEISNTTVRNSLREGGLRSRHSGELDTAIEDLYWQQV